MVVYSIIPQEVLDGLSKAKLIAVVRRLEERILAQDKRIEALEKRLGMNSLNSSQPPSSDGPEVPPAPPKVGSGKKRGGQPGHTEHIRDFLPLDKVSAVVEHKPAVCGRCGKPLSGEDPNPSRHQDLTATTALLGGFHGVLVSDRWGGYNRHAGRRQYCWAHVKRDFTRISEMSGEAGGIGRALLDAESSLFGFWHRVRDGTMARASFQAAVRPIRRTVKELLLRGIVDSLSCSGMCRELLKAESRSVDLCRRRRRGADQ
jgi:hypothetical protein